jgi:EAL domain-containing protein (putative c-di-GMP-specific phosphodiesterase class I)
VLHYQPQVPLGGGAPTGVEALVRWQHPERGVVSPADFIPVAEASGLIVPIGRWVLREACTQLARWTAAGGRLARLTMGINLSARQLAHPGLVDDVARILAETGVDPARVCLEITETAVLDDVTLAGERLAALKALGVRLAIDDFGTGFSSLDRLRRMPVESLKIDRSFIGDMDVTTGGTALVAAIIAMSHSLGLSVAAEGVETMEQLHELRRLGCDELQGYLLATPQPADELEALLRSGSIQSSIPPLDQNARAAVEVQEEMLRFIQRALGHGHEVERTTRSLLAELQRLVDTRIPA